jgi:hypothetical protein
MGLMLLIKNKKILISRPLRACLKGVEDLDFFFNGEYHM